MFGGSRLPGSYYFIQVDLADVAKPLSVLRKNFTSSGYVGVTTILCDCEIALEVTNRYLPSSEIRGLYSESPLNARTVLTSFAIPTVHGPIPTPDRKQFYSSNTMTLFVCFASDSAYCVD